MKHFTKFALAAAFALPFALSLSGCPGDGGGDDEGNLPSGNFCLPTCSADADCSIMGMDFGLSCSGGNCILACTTDDECVPALSGWAMECTAGGGECEMLQQVCVDIGGGVGRCATPPSDFVACADFGQAEYETTDIDGAAVTVCAQTGGMCGSTGCMIGCQSDADCSGSTPICNTGTGMCECGSDDDCAGNSASASVCNSDGICGCSTDQDCIDDNVGDVCFSGNCGCSGDDVCDQGNNPFDGGTVSCRAF